MNRIKELRGVPHFNSLFLKYGVLSKETKNMRRETSKIRKIQEDRQNGYSMESRRKKKETAVSNMR